MFNSRTIGLSSYSENPSMIADGLLFKIWNLGMHAKLKNGANRTWDLINCLQIKTSLIEQLEYEPSGDTPHR